MIPGSETPTADLCELVFLMFHVFLCFPADIRTVIDEFFDSSADGGENQGKILYECLSLLCGGAGAGECGGGVVGGGRFADCEAFVERLSFRLEQDRAQQNKVGTKTTRNLWHWKSDVIFCVFCGCFFYNQRSLRYSVLRTSNMRDVFAPSSAPCSSTRKSNTKPRALKM